MSELSDFYLNEETEFICGKEVPSIIKHTGTDYPSVVDRFFTKYYYRKPDTNDEDHLILFHSNRICLIGLAPSHVAFKKGISTVNFNIGNIDRTQNRVSGKGKKGAMNLQSNSALAIVTCSDGTEYKISSCVTGKLIEVNERLVTNPQLLSEIGDGYVAVCLPKIENCDKIKAELINEEEYSKISVEISTKNAGNIEPLK